MSKFTRTADLPLLKTVNANLSQKDPKELVAK